MSISLGEKYTVEAIAEKLDFIGYSREDFPGNTGSYSVVGNTVSIVNFRENRFEGYVVVLKDGMVNSITEVNPDGSVFDENLASVKVLNKANGFVLTFQHFERFFSSTVYIEVFLRSIYIAFVSTVVCLIIGYPTAYILANMKSRYRDFLSILFVLPMWMNFLLRTYAWRNLLEKSGVVNSLLTFLGLPEQNLMYTQSAVILCMVYNFLPFMILPIYNTLSKLDKSMIEASHDLGANHYQTLIKVVLPNSVPGIVSGITMTFVPSITAFAVSKIMGGTESMMIGEIIEREFKYDYWFGSAISVIIMILLLISMAFLSKYDKEETVGGGLI
ncbi:MAG: ABC transporter permease subunit [Clostridia bacterium]|nr:ABC transporter permease subunit [Clostridia bacterium]